MFGRKMAMDRARLEIQGASAEQFLNRACAAGLEMKDLCKQDQHSIRMFVNSYDIPFAEKLALSCCCSVKMLDSAVGAKMLKYALRRSRLLLIMIFLLLLLFWSKFYIWEIELNGNETVKSSEILSALQYCGIESGCFWPGLSSEDIRNRMLVLLPELAWINVNIKGSLASVDVVERSVAPMPRQFDCADIVASKSGFVLNVSTAVGFPAVQRGAAVSAGDILISGASDSAYAPPRFVCAKGRVDAETFTLITAVSPEKTLYKNYSGEKTDRFSLMFGNNRINFYSDSSFSGTGCDTIISVWKAEIPGVFSLPISIIRERSYFYETSLLSSIGDESKAVILQLLDERLDLSLEGGQVLERDSEVFLSEGLLWGVLRARCREDIGLLQPMSVERIEEINNSYTQKVEQINGGTQN